MRLLLPALLLSAAPLGAQGVATLTAADSALVGRILLAEDRRDSADAALVEGARHRDERVRNIAQRARWRIADPAFTRRDSLPQLAAPVSWPDPAWKTRYRALLPGRDDCGVIRTGLADSVWAVRLRAAAVVRASCANDSVIVGTFRQWIAALPANTEARAANSVSWHAAAHGAVALARLHPAEARAHLARLANHRQWQVRMYTARAAGAASDTALLLRLVRDRDDNVQEAAIDALARLTGHTHDAVFLTALSDSGAQVVRAAAIALKGSTAAGVRDSANAIFERWVRRASASEKDARVALLEAAGRPATDDRPPAPVVRLPARAVSLALGEEVRLRVTMWARSGGSGSFVVRLRGDNAPIMAARVLELVERGYYHNGNWWRVEHDFVIQGAGPSSNEYVGYHQFLRDELGNVPHDRGTVGMSTRGHHTGDAQWFINLKDNPALIRDYTIFAEVVEGMDVVDRIMEGDRIATITIARPQGSFPP